jgi:hypothetical protein
MKTLLLSFSFLLTITIKAQIITPIVKAFFGVDGEVKARNVNGALQSSDDWFLFPGTSGTTTNGTHVIDTTGAAALVRLYNTNVASRMNTFFRTMSRPQFSTVNNRIWMDAMFVRDYHGNDTTVFTSGADKNGQSPEYWSGGVQGIPDKNDILDMFVHVRRAGPTSVDSLWMFGGLSLDNVTGNRYFDFEMYQSDIYYDRTTAKWYGYGPDEGHVSWEFDALGRITKPGDIIFSAEYQSASLTNIEARIWVNRNALSITPASFNWSGQFDGAGTGAQFGYASILPKAAGAFYTGLQCGNNEWAGPFSLVLQDNSLTNNYIARQYMEFSVNLSKLGLDPVTLLGGDICGSPFNRVVVKTRASASFTAELKDFVAPLDLFLAPRADLGTNVPFFCGRIGVSDIWVRNPSPTSYYTWSTIDGHIVGTGIGQRISVDAPGTYIVTQRLSVGCAPYAYDTVTIGFDEHCWPLETGITQFKGLLKNQTVDLSWTTTDNHNTKLFEVERSSDGKNFYTIGTVDKTAPGSSIGNYSFADNASDFRTPFIYYRLRITYNTGVVKYSNLVKVIFQDNKFDLELYPNPAKNHLQLSIPSASIQQAKVIIYNTSGMMMYSNTIMLKPGMNTVELNLNRWEQGSFLAQITTSGQSLNKKFIISR